MSAQKSARSGARALPKTVSVWRRSSLKGTDATFRPKKRGEKEEIKKKNNEKMIKTHSYEDRQSLLETGWKNTKTK